MEDKLNMTMDWDKTFPKSGRVEHGKVCFHNRYGISLAADIYRPRGRRAGCPPWRSAAPSGR